MYALTHKDKGRIQISLLMLSCLPFSYVANAETIKSDAGIYVENAKKIKIFV